MRAGSSHRSEMATCSLTNQSPRVTSSHRFNDRTLSGIPSPSGLMRGSTRYRNRTHLTPDSTVPYLLLSIVLTDSPDFHLSKSWWEYLPYCVPCTVHCVGPHIVTLIIQASPLGHDTYFPSHELS